MIRCRLFGHKWRAYALDMPTFKYRCLRCGSRKEKRMPWTPIYAAPHMLHAVWDEAYGKGFEAARGEADTPNPYEEDK